MAPSLGRPPPNLRAPRLTLTASVRRNRFLSEPRVAPCVNHKTSHSIGGQCCGTIPNIAKMQVFPVRQRRVWAVLCQKRREVGTIPQNGGQALLGLAGGVECSQHRAPDRRSAVATAKFTGLETCGKGAI